MINLDQGKVTGSRLAEIVTPAPRSPMTPLMISIALWYHCRVGDFNRGGGDTNFETPAVQEALRLFESKGLLVEDEKQECVYRGTEALVLFVETLLATPFPVQKWVMP